MKDSDKFRKGFAGEEEAATPALAELASPPADTNGDAIPAPANPDEPNPDEGLHGEMPTGVEAEPAPGGEGGGEEGMPPMNQNEKTWDGRLRKREEDIKRREQELAEREAKLAGGGEPAPEGEQTPAGEPSAEEAAATMSADEAIARLKEDFGEEFVSMIQAVAGAAAAKAAGDGGGDMVQKVEDAMNEIRGAFEYLHNEAIADAHEDYEAVVASPEFAQWVESLTDEERASTEQVLESGTARQVVKVLNAFKDHLKEQATPEDAQPDTSALDAAAGVRSTGMAVPSTSAVAGPVDGFRKGWSKA